MAAAHFAVLGVPDAVAVAIHVLDHAGVTAAEFLLRYLAVAIGVMLLEPVDHALAHGVEPQRLVFADRQHPVAILVEFLQLPGARPVDLFLGQPAVLVGIEGPHHSHAATVTATLHAAAMPLHPALVLAATFLGKRRGESCRAERGDGGRRDGNFDRAFHGNELLW